LFAAIDIGPDVAAAARSLIDELRQRVLARAPRARITWVAPDRLHMTLRFIGEVDDRQVEAVERALVPQIAQPLFTFEAGGLGVFPPKGSPRVVWAGVRSEVGALRSLEREVSHRLEAVGIPRDPHAYHPHLTLGRVREPAGLRATTLIDGLDQASVLGLVEVRSITLYSSRLLPHGPEHRALLRTPLGD